MAKARFTSTTPLEMRLLSELDGAGPISPTDLAKRSGVPRPSVYVFLRRLDTRKLVRRRAAGIKYSGPVQYEITAAGRKERRVFARMVGLTVD